MSYNYYVYDLEVYPNIFTFGGKFAGHDDIYLFEISDRINQKQELLNHLNYLRSLGIELVGFNNLGYDQYFLDEIINNPYTFTYQKAYQISQNIINSQRNGVKIVYIGPNKRVLPQIDLMKICHFDNDAKRTSLKALQFAMRSESLEDLPFDIRDLNDQEKDKLKLYNVHDIHETEKFLNLHTHLIDMRREYITDGILTGDVLNYNDVKIGVEYLINRIGKHKCYSGGKPKQTFRTFIEFKKIILDKIKFRTEVFQEVLSWFKSQTVYVTSEDKPTLEVSLAGLMFYFGSGGVHASAENKIFHSDENYQIIDIDVEGMYPAVAVVNKFAPEHLGESFVIAYNQIREDRKKYPKGSSRNAVLKLASNGGFGNFNNSFSPLYDPQCLFSVTINGQLQILQLVEMLSLIPQLEIIQANTDGITIIVHKDFIYLFNLWCREWEAMTGLKLEEVPYKRMWIRDVNNYIAEKVDGKFKLKGAYWYPKTIKDYEGVYNKDFSNLASIKAAVKALTHSWPIETAIRLVTDPFDFMLRYKATGASKLYIGDEKQLRTVRYYVSKTGKPMRKVAPPKGTPGYYKRKNKLKDEYFKKILTEIGTTTWDERIHTKNKEKYPEQVETSVQSGWLVKECNLASKFDFKDIDWNYYIQEAKKLIIGNN